MQNFLSAFVDALFVFVDCFPNAKEVLLDGLGEGGEIDWEVGVEVVIVLGVHVNKFIANIII